MSFEEGASVFSDALAFTFRDPDHSVREMRFLTFGISQNGNLLVLSHTYRNDLVRII